jgi:nuclear pore complex protein Nup133
MFSPSVNGTPAGTVRSSRRRPRPDSESSISQPKAKRQRSALSEQTFVPPDGASEMHEVKSNKVSTVDTRQDSKKEAQGLRREIAVRGRKLKVGDKGNKGDGSIILVCLTLAAHF